MVKITVGWFLINSKGSRQTVRGWKRQGDEENLTVSADGR